MSDKKEVDSKWTLYQRNVVDKYKDVSTEDIKADLKKNALPFAVIAAQIEGDFNFSSIIRSANAFGAKEIYYYGKRQFDRRGTCGTHLYKDVIHLPTIDDLKKVNEQYRFVALENNTQRQSIPLKYFHWTSPTAILVGEENSGLSDEVLDLCDYFVEIPMLGSVRSLNAAVAASVAMYDFVSKYHT